MEIDDARNSQLARDEISKSDVETALGETMDTAFDLARFRTGDQMGVGQYLEREIADARAAENDAKRTIRKNVFPKIKDSPSAPKGADAAGVFKAAPELVDEALRKIVFAGGVQAVDGTSVLIDTLPITIAQIGVCSTTYRGNQGEWGHRFFRRDYRKRSGDDIEDMIALLEARKDRAAYEKSSRRDGINDMLRRGFMTWAERSVLAYKCDAPWRMGHGNPLAYELLTGSGLAELIKRSLPVLEEIVSHKKFVFVPSSADRMYTTIAGALEPSEYAIVTTAEHHLKKILNGGYRGSGYAQILPTLEKFATAVGPDVVMGFYRVSSIGPPHAFYAHREHAHTAALIAMADGALLEHRGFPMLIDLADKLCATMFQGETLKAATNLAFLDAGSNLDFATERMTR